MNEFLSWAVSLLGETLSWLSSMELVSGVTLLGFLGACFILGLMIRNLLFRAE